ncbi:MAG: methylmalonyl-CoA mutase family protein, partial [Syntrophales bacterium]|nr:methylmalonyl-CoA mutase family protein [Syntrophales bacterium]
EETGVIDVVDPLGGSFYVEALTDEIERRILDEIDEIERAGGYVACIENGLLHKKITNYFTTQQREIEDGQIKIVAYNIYKSETEPPPINVFRYPEGVEERQRERLGKLRLRRDNDRVATALNALHDACKRKINIVPFSVDCARARCTEGELYKVFKEAFGLWRPPALW